MLAATVADKEGVRRQTGAPQSKVDERQGAEEQCDCQVSARRRPGEDRRQEKDEKGGQDGPDHRMHEAGCEDGNILRYKAGCAPDPFKLLIYQAPISRIRCKGPTT